MADGHGSYGKNVSDFVIKSIGKNIDGSLKSVFEGAKMNAQLVKSSDIKFKLSQCFSGADEKLQTESGINLKFSGTTCVTVLIVAAKIYCANTGDSRAILARASIQSSKEERKMLALPLSRDHKGEDEDEYKRIIKAGGRVSSYVNTRGKPVGPLRVWHALENMPGLAMTRSFGDMEAHKVGVIATAEIKEVNMTLRDKFIIIGSDGIWEFITNDEAIEIVMPHYEADDAEMACESLVEVATERWRKYDASIDDITCVIVFLNT